MVSDGRSIRVVSDHPDPVCAPGEALVRVTRTLLTPADVLAARRVVAGGGEGAGGAGAGGGRVHVGVLGHRFVGVVKAINIPGDAPHTLAARKGWVGRRVVASPAVVCAQCDLCRRGLSPHCRARKVIGVHERDGCLADLVCVPASALQQVPEGVDDDAATFALDLAGAAHAGHLVRVEGHAYVTVIGDSALALITAQVLAQRNATVRLLSSSSEAARVCERWGLKQRGLDEPGRRQDQDVVVDCSGAAPGLRLALQLVRPRGMVMLKNPAALAPFTAGATLGPTPAAYQAGVDLSLAVVNEVQIVGSREGALPDGLTLLKERAVDVAGLISRRVRLAEAPAALSGEPGGALGVIVDMDAR